MQTCFHFLRAFAVHVFALFCYCFVIILIPPPSLPPVRGHITCCSPSFCPMRASKNGRFMLDGMCIVEHEIVEVIFGSTVKDQAKDVKAQTQNCL